MATFMDKYFSKFQCGFRKGYSTQQYLIGFIERRKNAVDSGKSFGSLLTDLSKAFDCFPHELLLADLSAYGFGLSTLRLICSYLCNRQQRTKINASYSSCKSHSFCLEFHKDPFWDFYFLTFSCVTCLLFYKKLTLLVLQMIMHPLYLKLLLKMY